MSILNYIEKMKEMYEGPRITAHGPRNMYAGGQLVRNTVDGSRPGYGGPGSGGARPHTGGDRSMYIDYEARIKYPGTKKIKIAETKYSKKFNNLKGMDLWKAIGTSKRSNIVQKHITGGTSGVPGGKLKKNMLSKTDFIELVGKNRDKTYNEFVEIIKKYKTKEGTNFTKSIVANRLRDYNLSGSFQKEPSKGDSPEAKKAAEKKRKIWIDRTAPATTKIHGTKKFPFHHIMQIGGEVPLTTDDIAIIEQRMNSKLSKYNKPLNNIADAISKNHKLALEAMNAKNEGLALDYMKRVNQLNESAEKIVNKAIKELPKSYRNLIGFNQFTLPTNEYGLPIQNEPLLVKKIGGIQTKGAIPLTDLTLDQEKALRAQIKADAKAGKNINQKKFLNTFSKTFQDLSPQSVLQMARTHKCGGLNGGGSIMSCLQKKFKADPEKFLQRSASLAKGNPNLRKWFMRGRNIAKGTGVFALWEAAFAPLVTGWMATEGESWERMKHDLSYGPILEALGVSPKFVPGISVEEEWMKAAGGDESARTMKKMEELQDQELPYLYQQRDAAINKTANVPKLPGREGKGYQQLLIERKIKEKELELQDIWNKSGFMEGPAGGKGDFKYLNMPVIRKASTIKDAADAKVIADKAATKEKYIDWGIVTGPGWYKQEGRIGRMGGGMVGIRKPSAIAPTGGPQSQGLASTPEYDTYNKEYKWQT